MPSYCAPQVDQIGSFRSTISYVERSGKSHELGFYTLEKRGLRKGENERCGTTALESELTWTKTGTALTEELQLLPAAKGRGHWRPQSYSLGAILAD